MPDMNHYLKWLGGRKFIAWVAIMAMAYVPMLVGALEQEIWQSVTIWVTGLMVTANVASKVASKPPKPPPAQPFPSSKD